MTKSIVMEEIQGPPQIELSFGEYWRCCGFTCFLPGESEPSLATEGSLESNLRELNDWE